VKTNRDLCVTFDLWETLIADESEFDVARGRMRCEGIHRVLDGMGVKVPLGDIQRAYEESDPQLDVMWGRDENPTPTDQIELIFKSATNGKTSLPQDSQGLRMLEDAYVDPILVSPPKLKEDALSTLEGVRERVGRLGLISNTGRSPGAALRKVMEKYGILGFFDATIFSDEAGSRKPNRSIFETAAKELHVGLSKMVHVGDNPEADVWGAKQAGMRAVLLEYDVPQSFRNRPTSLFALSRAKHIQDSEIHPDARIKSLREVLDFVDSLK
jgi:HAD superfamily hydrolase (TIGR01509 family)